MFRKPPYWDHTAERDEEKGKRKEKEGELDMYKVGKPGGKPFQSPTPPGSRQKVLGAIWGWVYHPH